MQKFTISLKNIYPLIAHLFNILHLSLHFKCTYTFFTFTITSFYEKFLVILKAGFILYHTEMLRRFLFSANGIRSLPLRLCSTETLKPSFDAPESDLDGRNSIKQNDTFESLLRNSIFVKMGDPVGKVSLYRNAV